MWTCSACRRTSSTAPRAWARSTSGRQGVELDPLIHGGSQEGCLRAGTENMAGIVGLGAAADLARRSLDNNSVLYRCMKSFQQISCILTHLEKDNVLRTKRANCCRKVLFQRSI